MINHLKENPSQLDPNWLARFEDLAKWLDRQKLGEKKMFISKHDDELVEVEQGFSGNQRPEDYIEGFSRFVKEHVNEIQALKIIAQRPKDLTRQELRELRIKLDEKGYTEDRLRNAYKQVNNKDVAASIIGYIRRETMGDPLVPFEKRLEQAISKIKEYHTFKPVQIKWIDRIAEQLKKELVVDKEALDKGAFKLMGGYKRASKIFDGEIENILGELQESIWAKAATG